MEQCKSHSIHLRLTDDHYAFLSNMAHTMGVGVADVLRILVNGYMVASSRLAQKDAKLGDLYADDSNNQ